MIIAVGVACYILYAVSYGSSQYLPHYSVVMMLFIISQSLLIPNTDNYNKYLCSHDNNLTIVTCESHYEETITVH